MRSIESSGKTMEDAVTQGLDRLGVSLGDVAIDIISEGTKGFLGMLGGKPAVVRLTVREEDGEALSGPALEQGKRKKSGRGDAEGKGKTPKTGRREPAAKEVVKGQVTLEELSAEAVSGQKPEGEAPIQPAPLCDPETPQGKAQQFLLKVTELMGVPVSVAAGMDGEGNVRVDMHGDTLGILIGRRGETLDALQYLTSLHVNRGREEYTRCTLDTENYRAKREEALTRLANRMANRAVKTGRKVVMEPMNPYERRILHNALQQNEAVTTHSEGDEPNRHVVITLRPD
ncbi:MAG: protein jag [Clostridia bacterium]|nr:protein jag [Clostridia bacterium]